ncbi:DinB family protein [bacterium]|nr:DinB family protein [bacterium]
MNVADLLVAEMNVEFPNTRKYLEIVPEEKFEFKPHQKSGSLIWLASHVADLPVFATRIVEADEYDLKARPVRPAPPENADELLEKFDHNAADAIAQIQGKSDEFFASKWTLRAGETVIFELPRAMCVRVMMMNHMIHHRAQLGVYLRLLDVHIPGLYGPSADEPRRF